MDYTQAIKFVENLPTPSDWKLDRMRRFALKAGVIPQKSVFIHVTGSNGKGSTSAFLYSILRQAGFSVALFSSPHLTDYRERFLFDGKLISEKKFSEIAGKLKANALKERVSQFEFLTGIALKWFGKEKPDFIVWEVGLGGRLDATNIIDAAFAAITPISLEHTEKLGKTIKKIAWEKSKIIKPGAVVATPNSGIALKVIEKECKAKGALLVKVPKPSKIVCTENGTAFVFGGRKWNASLLGSHQAQNACTAIALAKQMGFNDSIIAKGLANARWPGRMQIFSKKPLVVLDGAHNSAGVKALAGSYRKIFGLNPILVTGVMADKDWDKMAKEFCKLKPSMVITCAPANPRSLDAETLAKEFVKNGANAFAASSVREAFGMALENALAENKKVLVAGSLYLVGEVLSA